MATIVDPANPPPEPGYGSASRALMTTPVIRGAAVPAGPVIGGVPAAAHSPIGPGSVGGILTMEGQAGIDARKATAEQFNNAPLIQGLTAYVRGRWSSALEAKRNSVEDRMLKSVRQRRGIYDDDILSEIKLVGGSQIYMMLTSNKCRAAASWIRDVMLGAGKDKPWTIDPTKIPELPPQVKQSVMAQAVQEAQMFTQMTGLPVGPEFVERDAVYLYDRVQADAKKQATERMARMEDKMEDQLAEGGFSESLDEFINDIVTFPSAILKGPVVRKTQDLEWTQDAEGKSVAKAVDTLRPYWDRVDPFMAYPAAHASGIDDGDFIERHRLSRASLYEMKGVEGYSSEAIDAVLDVYGRNGLNDWLAVDTEKANVEGKSTANVSNNPGNLIDALQFWGSVQGKLLVEWGMPEASLPDQLKDYPCEVWMIGSWCIKAVLNPDPLGRKPYYKASYEEVPGAFWGNSVADLARDSQTQCNVAARAIANNMGIASGPQMTINVDRLPAGEDITQMFPWKIHQHTSDPYGSTAKAIDFFMPPMIGDQLIGVYNFFSALADEHTGVPRYMTGDATQQGGALRTSSGMSMLMQNAGKAIKQVIGNIDRHAIEPCIGRLWFYNMLFGTDPALKGDAKFIARGASSLVIKETQQQRINEFMQLALSNPLVGQIVGEEAIASLLRIAAKNLDMDTDAIVPPPEVIRKRVAEAAQAAQASKAQEQSFALQMATAAKHEVTTEVAPEGVTTTTKDTIPHVGVGAGAPPMPTGVEGADGSNPPTTMSGNGQGAVDLMSPRRTH